MTSLYTHKDQNILKTWLLFTVFFGIVIGFGYLMAQVYRDSSILYFAVGFSVLMSVVSYWFSDRIVLATSNAKPVSLENAPELYRIVENLSITAGLPMPRVFLVPEEQPNAFATGRNPKHAVVAVTEGLLRKLDRTELEGVLAHELSHIGNRDMLVSTVAVVLVGFISILADMFTRSMLFGGMRNRDNNGRGGGPMLLIGVILAALAPIAATLMQLAISRRREYLADASGALLTRYPEGLARALEKISADRSPMRVAAHNATAHLWLANPFKAKSRGLDFQEWFMTHPPMEKRIAALRAADTQK